MIESVSIPAFPKSLASSSLVIFSITALMSFVVPSVTSSSFRTSTTPRPESDTSNSPRLVFISSTVFSSVFASHATVTGSPFQNKSDSILAARVIFREYNTEKGSKYRVWSVILTRSRSICHIHDSSVNHGVQKVGKVETKNNQQQPSTKGNTMNHRTQPRRIMHGSEQFPILFEGGGIWVYKNPTDEIFVENTGKNGVCLRIGSNGNGELSVSTHRGRVVSPWLFVVSGMR